jgi:SanA protein
MWNPFKRWAVILLLAGSSLAVLWMLGASALVDWAASGRTYSEVRLIPHRQVGLVRGCVKLLPGGLPNPNFNKRVAAAAELYRAGKIDYLLVSGDNYVPFYLRRSQGHEGSFDGTRGSRR